MHQSKRKIVRHQTYRVNATIHNEFDPIRGCSVSVIPYLPNIPISRYSRTSLFCVRYRNTNRFRRNDHRCSTVCRHCFKRFSIVFNVCCKCIYVYTPGRQRTALVFRSDGRPGGSEENGGTLAGHTKGGLTAAGWRCFGTKLLPGEAVRFCPWGTGKRRCRGRENWVCCGQVSHTRAREPDNRRHDLFRTHRSSQPSSFVCGVSDYRTYVAAGRAASKGYAMCMRTRYDTARSGEPAERPFGQISFPGYIYR